MGFKMRSPTSIALKICGITRLDQAKEIASYGVDAIGVIGVHCSPRFVEEQQRRKLFAELKLCSPSLKRVWVVADLNEIDLDSALIGEGTPSAVQLHGNETPERCQVLRKKFPNIEWWKALRIRTANDLLLAESYKSSIDYLLLDAWSPNELGGSGQRIPLEWLQEQNHCLPWWLAGGISSELVPEIIKQVRPFGIDASSKLEIYPGIKDLKLVSSLVKSLQKISNQLMH